MMLNDTRPTVRALVSVLILLFLICAHAHAQAITYVCSPTLQKNPRPDGIDPGIHENAPPLVIEVDASEGTIRFLNNAGRMFAKVDHVRTTRGAYSFYAGETWLNLETTDGSLTYGSADRPKGWDLAAGYIRGSINRDSGYAEFSQGWYSYAKGKVAAGVDWYPLFEGPCRTKGTAEIRSAPSGFRP